MIAKVIIAGGRDFKDFDLLVKECDYLLSNLSKEKQIVIVSGKANGADKLGERYAKLRGYAIDAHPADWDKYRRAAGYIRNEEMAKDAQYLIAFWDGTSKGTSHMIDLAHKHNLGVRVVRYD